MPLTYNEMLYAGHLDYFKKVYFDGKLSPPPFYSRNTMADYEYQKLLMPITCPEPYPDFYDQSKINSVVKVKDSRIEIIDFECFQIYSDWFQWLQKKWLGVWTPQKDCDNYALFTVALMGSFEGWSNASKIYIETLPHPWNIGEVEFHAWNIFVLARLRPDNENVENVILAYEPQGGFQLELKKGDLLNSRINEYVQR